MLVYNKLIFILTFSLVDAHIYLYHTQDGRQLEFYDCVVFQSLHYCRRPTLPIDLNRDHQNQSCQLNGGLLHTFRELQVKHINTSAILHQWRSSIERVEQYSRYLTHSTTNNESHICQCIDSASFGKNCEYQLPVGDTFKQTLEWRLKLREENPKEVQIHGDIVCYTTLTCDSVQLCLDWREICDGIQNCPDGTDEENCDLLEMNVCDTVDEYRCMNGMCIPDEYFLDGEFDCLDWSDEIQYKKSEECARQSVSGRCDDHVCPPNEWSCGDGQCIRDRMGFRLVASYTVCQSFRDQYFMCEANINTASWTMPNGRCYEASSYVEPLLTNRTQHEHCEHLLRCYLSQGKQKSCPKLREPSWNDEIRQYCLNRYILYPKKPSITSFIYTHYQFTTNLDENSLKFGYAVHGTVKCRQSLINITEPYTFPASENTGRTIHDQICRKVFPMLFPEIPLIRHDCHHQNESISICDEWNSCMSITRLRDGFTSCLNRRDETENGDIDVHQSCLSVQRHRFRCSGEQLSCLNLIALGDGKFDCNNRFDESWFGTGRPLSLMHCDDHRKDQCSLLRRYIEQSWNNKTHHEKTSLIDFVIPFRSYCDTFWDLDPPEDENRVECRRWWMCAQDQQRCPTKQCYDRLWYGDDEWDCPGVVDEVHRLRWNAKSIYSTVLSNNASESQPSLMSSDCNQTNPFVCLSRFTSVPQFYCINQSRIDDGQIDCVGAIDEQGTHKRCSQSQPLGPYFLCLSTNTCIPYFYHCQPGYRCPNRNDDQFWCSHFDQSTYLPNINDFRCMDGQQKSNVRCDKTVHCPYQEDEYMCDYLSTKRQKLVPFRSEKQFQMSNKRKYFRLPHFPSDALTSQQLIKNNASTQFTPTISPYRRHSSSSSSINLTAYRCNRGIGVIAPNNQTICFCPPQYFGDRCQYHNDRLAVLLHLNLSQSIYSTTTSPNITLKLLLIFFHHHQSLMTHEFHVRPAFKDTMNEKMRVTFVYSHASDSRQQRQSRYFNRSDILHHHPYLIQIDLYELRADQRPLLVTVWKYPIFFDYLPVSHFAKVLHLRHVNESENPCSSDPCPRYATCHPLMNDHYQYVCVNQTNDSNTECRDQYCAEGSLCKSNYRIRHRGNHHPYCICPYNRLGHQCEIENDQCKSNPCLNEGSCYPSMESDQFFCRCTKDYHGLTCQWKKSTVQLSIDAYFQQPAITLQFFDIDFTSLDLNLVHQRVLTSFPPVLDYYRPETTIPNIILAKIYSSYRDASAELFLLSIFTDTTSVIGKTNLSETNHCSHTRTLFEREFLVDNHLELTPIQYHFICQNKSDLLCFRDDHYLCICVDDHSRVECFIYDHRLDQCSLCLSGGRCLKGDPTRSSDFLCLCPPCYSGRQCQFSSKFFSITLDQLFFTDLVSNHRQRTMPFLIVLPFLTALFGLPNNIFSFVTLRRHSCLRHGIGYYLICLSIINQINLTLLLARAIHASLIITIAPSRPILDHIFCKLFNYLLICFIRLASWLTSFVSLERCYTTLFMKRYWFRQPHIARRLICLTMIITLLSSADELILNKSFSAFDYEGSGGTTCVLEFPQHHRSLLIWIHQFVFGIHFLCPLLINFVSTTTIIIIIIKTKMNLYQSQQQMKMQSTMKNKKSHRQYLTFRDVLDENKEMITRPVITLIPSIFSLFSLPSFIIAFSLQCQNIENNPLRYLLITFYFITFVPSMTTFFLYIYPSSLFWSKWKETSISQRIETFRHQRRKIEEK